MIRAFAIGMLLTACISSPAIAREFRLSVFTGVLQTDQALNVTDATRFTGGVEARMQIRGRAGYFIHFALSPAKLRRLAAIQRNESGVLFAHFAVGPCIRLIQHPLDISWRIGYGAVGDELTAHDLIFQGIIVARPITARAFLRVDLHHVLIDFSHFGSIGLTAGIGWRL